MKTKYFEFSKNGGSEKYSEFTEAEYLKAKEEDCLLYTSDAADEL